jgi:hypothetical protein
MFAGLTNALFNAAVIKILSFIVFFQTFDSMEIPENLTEAMMEMETAKETVKETAATTTEEAVSDDKENQKSSANDEDKIKKEMRFMLSGVQDDEKIKFVILSRSNSLPIFLFLP